MSKSKFNPADEVNPAKRAKKAAGALKSGDAGTLAKEGAKQAAKSVAGAVAAKLAVPLLILLLAAVAVAGVVTLVTGAMTEVHRRTDQVNQWVDYVVCSAQAGGFTSVLNSCLDRRADDPFLGPEDIADEGGAGAASQVGMDEPEEDGIPQPVLSTYMNVGNDRQVPWMVLTAIGDLTTKHGLDAGDDEERDSPSGVYPQADPPIVVEDEPDVDDVDDDDDGKRWLGPLLIDADAVEQAGVSEDRVQHQQVSIDLVAGWLRELVADPPDDVDGYDPSQPFAHESQHDVWMLAVSELPVRAMHDEQDARDAAEEIFRQAYDWYMMQNSCPPDASRSGSVAVASGSLEGLPDSDPIELGDSFGLWDTEFTEEHLENAQLIVGVGEDHDIPPRGWVIALATAMIESHLVNLPGGDRDSLGLFQQRPSTGWGTPEEIMDPVKSSEAFYGVASHLPGGGNKGLLQISECPTCVDPPPAGTPWEEWPPGEAAQAVQISGHPERYGQVIDDAVGILKTVLDGEIPVGFDDCEEDEDDRDERRREWACPVEEDLLVTSPYGPRWGRLHAGIDFGGPTGEPIFASKEGTVTAAESYGGYGQTIVVDHGDGTSTLYAHQSAFTAGVGDQVGQGEQIGEVGSTGQSTGPHLHFEIREGGVGLDGDPTDPAPHLGLPAGDAAVGMPCEDAVGDEPVEGPELGECTEVDPTGGRCLTPQMLHVYEETAVFFPDWEWGVACQNDRPPGTPQGHTRGLACDYTVGQIGAYPPPDDVERGWELADWYVDHADTLQIDYVIWQNLIWSQRRASEGWRDYGGDGPTYGHYDHIHVQVFAN